MKCGVTSCGSGSPDRAIASDPTKYTSSNFQSATYVNPLAIYGPNPFLVASTVEGALPACKAWRSALSEKWGIAITWTCTWKWTRK